MTVSDSALSDRLQGRWSERFPARRDVGPRLVARYADPERVYHGLRHLHEVLDGVDVLGSECADPVAVELAGWFHDAVYDVHRSDNEFASAALARELLAGSPSVDVDEVARLVLLTVDHRVEAGDTNGAVLCDADLAILAADLERYDDYARQVRREYAQVTDADFRTGRREVLENLLALPSLFHTRHGAEHWEAPARANLRRELTTL